MSITYSVTERTIFEVIEHHEDKDVAYIMDDFETESEAEGYKLECEAARDSKDETD